MGRGDPRAARWAAKANNRLAGRLQGGGENGLEVDSLSKLGDPGLRDTLSAQEKGTADRRRGRGSRKKESDYLRRNLKREEEGRDKRNGSRGMGRTLTNLHKEVKHESGKL